MTSKKAALLYGINYIQSPEMQLRGCWNDAMLLNSLLINEPYNFPQSSIEMVLDNDYSNKTGKYAMLCALYKMALKSWTENLETVVVSYSGHGTNVVDFNGDEADGRDEGICPSDCQTAGLILDDQLYSIFKQFNPKTTIYVIIDSCHSGTMLDLPFSSNLINIKPTESIVSPHIIMVSGCMDIQYAADTYNYKTRKFGGALTMSIVDVLQNKKEGLLDFFGKLKENVKMHGYPQIPILSSSKPLTNDIHLFISTNIF